MDRLKKIGFEQVGFWKLENEKLIYELTKLENNKNVLYAFISDNQIKYIGKTVCSLNQRMYGYQNPGSSQTTNIKNNKLIKECLQQGKTLIIWALADNELFRYGEFHLNLAAGLEDSLIKAINPEWNNTGKQF